MKEFMETMRANPDRWGELTEVVLHTVSSVESIKGKGIHPGFIASFEFQNVIRRVVDGGFGISIGR
jgi:hypothetical protein